MRVHLLLLLTVAYTASAFGQCPSGQWCSGGFQYDGSGNVKAIGADVYTYDVYGRLMTGTADVQRTGSYSRQDYTYDAFGNRTAVSRAAGSVGCVGGCELPVVTSSTTNHITSNGAQYDPAGNLIAIDSATYSYDAAGSLVRATSSDDREFIYTAEDERIATKNGVSWTWTVRGGDNKILREFTSLATSLWPTVNRQWAKDYVWRDGQLLATTGPATPGASTTFSQHYHVDQLGTPRVVSDSAGVTLGQHAYYPFGAELDIVPHESRTEFLKFTSHERDLLPGGDKTLDYMHARSMMASLGRFLSPDPILGNPLLPQSWNRYAYVINSPLTSKDPTGMKPCTVKLYGHDAELAKVADGTSVDAECVDAEADKPKEEEKDDPPVTTEKVLEGISNLSAGFGDTITFGATRKAREYLGSEQVVDHCSYSFRGGQVLGVAWWTAFSGAFAGEAWGASVAETELGNITVGTAEFNAELRTLSAAQKLAKFGGTRGALLRVAKNAGNPAWYLNLAKTTVTTGPTYAGEAGLLGASIGTAGAAASDRCH